jgi:hypothetical protein
MMVVVVVESENGLSMLRTNKEIGDSERLSVFFSGMCFFNGHNAVYFTDLMGAVYHQVGEWVSHVDMI